MPTNSNRVSTGSLLVPILRSLVGDMEFTIISNNCWGAHVYQALKTKYRTPFIGLFIPPGSYLELLRRFDHYIKSELTFTRESRVPALNVWRDQKGMFYPIGLLDGQVELHFQHYVGEDDARSKWRRRCQRISRNPKRLFFKFDDREGATVADIEEFCSLSFPNKVCFTRGAYAMETIVIPGDPGTVHVCDGLALSRISQRYFNTLRWISTRSVRLPIPSIM